MKMRATVWDKHYEVDVYQQSKSVWIASGDYMGKNIQTQDRSQRTAFARWCEAARYRGNDGPVPSETT